MRNPWSTDSEYIVTIAKQLIGEHALASLIEENKRACNPAVLHRFLAGILRPKISKMNTETLGRICGYASSNGAHAGKHHRNTVKPKFINRIGLADVLTPSLHVWLGNLGVGEHLEQIAVATISCAVFDMMFQDKWQSEWDSHEMTPEDEDAEVEYLLDRAERDMAHGQFGQMLWNQLRPDDESTRR